MLHILPHSPLGPILLEHMMLFWTARVPFDLRFLRRARGFRSYNVDQGQSNPCPQARNEVLITYAIAGVLASPKGDELRGRQVLNHERPHEAGDANLRDRLGHIRGR